MGDVNTPAHRERLRRTYEIAAEQTGAGLYDGDKFEELMECAQREDWWRAALSEMGLLPADIDREVRRVDALAAGRLVRETETRWRVIQGANAWTYTKRGEAIDMHEATPRSRFVTVTFHRIRRPR